MFANSIHTSSRWSISNKSEGIMGHEKQRGKSRDSTSASSEGLYEPNTKTADASKERGHQVIERKLQSHESLHTSLKNKACLLASMVL